MTTQASNAANQAWTDLKPAEDKPDSVTDHSYELIKHILRETGCDLSTLVYRTYPNLLDKFEITQVLFTEGDIRGFLKETMEQNSIAALEMAFDVIDIWDWRDSLSRYKEWMPPNSTKAEAVYEFIQGLVWSKLDGSEVEWDEDTTSCLSLDKSGKLRLVRVREPGRESFSVEHLE